MALRATEYAQRAQDEDPWDEFESPDIALQSEGAHLGVQRGHARLLPRCR